MKATLGGVLGKIPIPSPAMAVALLALLIAASGAAVAAIPSNGTITACYVKSNGALRVIDTGQTCTSKETQLTWKDGSTLLGKNEKAADSDKLDNKDSTEFLGANQAAVDSDKLDGRDSMDFLGANQKAADSDKLDGKDSSAFYAQGAKVADSSHADQADSAASANSAADADTLDGKDSSEFLGTNQRLTTDNVARAAGTTTLDFGPIGAQSCSDRSVSAGTDISNDVVAATLGSNDLLPLSFYTAGSSSNSNAFRLVVCNPTAGTYDPPSTTYRWVAFDQPACAECEQIAVWESAAQTDLRNAATAANACYADYGSYANCTTIAQLVPYGFSPTNGVVVNGINGTISNWSASMQHSSGGSAFTYATFGPNAGQVVRVPRGTGAPVLP